MDQNAALEAEFVAKSLKHFIEATELELDESVTVPRRPRTP